ncbi:DUF1643 domain-containing protein [Bacillus spizizenii]|uniref:DUF1643 domain-containing protein n=1 Tax=Bacillus spizizenii TaxID=96241 RepID=UPI0022832ADF|nr:DUF1643 domain-containing protein [Bacillus spizizenii]MCY8882369.1 DUF1643 domain-containing protein [Bacillus spizizenii]MCY8893829.1 DUF1643 domain-containing protein [Bacillus spizizenii]MEC1592509.1 DUF1643 domain-containing protein [Bacillus spizizenii]
MTHYYDSNKVDISSITIDDRQNIIPGVNLRYSLSIPFKNRMEMEGITVTVILMNPSEADSNISDRTVNKLIDFFYCYTHEKIQVKKLYVGNVIPIYAPNPADISAKLKSIHGANLLNHVQKNNINTVSSMINDSDIVVLAWGKPNVKTVHNLYYYSQVYKIIEVISNTDKDIFVFNMGNTNTILTEHGDPRHAGRSATLIDLIRINSNELLGLA